MSDYVRSASPAPFEARLLGRVTGCTNPESAELLPDGEHFIFGNCTLIVGVPEYRDGKGIVYRRDRAFISLARLSDDGSVSLVAREHVTGLTATLGIDILRAATKNFPAGTAFNVQGGNPVIAEGRLLDPDTEARPRIAALDGLNGKILGVIGLDADSPIGRRFNRIDQPNGCAVDAVGNLYFGDIPNGNPEPEGPPPVPSAVYRLPHGDLDALASGLASSADGVLRIPFPGFVNGLAASPLDDSIIAVSCSYSDPVNGGVYRLTPSDFEAGRQPEPMVRDLGILDGVGVTRRGTLLVSTPVTGEVHAFTTDGRHFAIKANGANLVRMPADFNVCYPRATAGEPCLLVTDISVGMPEGDGSVAVVEIAGL